MDNTKVEKIKSIIADGDTVIVYGAGLMAKSLKTCIADRPFNFRVSCYVVRSEEGNPKEIEGVPVISLKNAYKYKNKKILVALHEKHLYSAMKELREHGFLNTIPVSFDCDLWSDIRKIYIENAAEASGLCFKELESETLGLLHLYVAHSIYDKPLIENISYNNYEIPIQVGRALSGKQICEVTDATGDNISDKNRKYSELTALYWIWKHDKSKYSGLSHYRRKFCISNSQVENLEASDIDVVMTVPVLNINTVKRQYALDHCKADWVTMINAISELSPQYLNTAKQVQDGTWYYAYNMFISRKEILDKYCEWLFPILKYCEERIGDKEDSYQNRYVGFLSERLQTIYFKHNESHYKTVIGEKHFFETER